MRGRTRLWQAGSLVILGAGTALALVPLRERLGPPKSVSLESAKTPTADEVLRQLNPATPPPDSGLVKEAEILAGLAPEYKLIDRPVVVEPPKVEPVTPLDKPPTPAIATGVEFLGSVTSPKGVRSALLRNQGKQIFLREGDTREGLHLVEVTTEHAMVGLGDAPAKKIILNPRISAWSGTPASPAGTPPLGVGGRGPFHAPQPVPTRPSLDPNFASRSQNILNMEPALRDSLVKEIADASTDAQNRARAMRELGVNVNSTVQQRDDLLRQAGFEINSDPAIRDLINDAWSSIQGQRTADPQSRWDDRAKSRGSRR